MKDEALAARCRGLKLLLSDVDGVMTDGTVLLLPDGGEAKAFHIRDGLGIVLAQRAGLRTGLVTGRSSAVVERRAAELGMAVVRQGVRDKGQALREILAAEGLRAEEVAYIGDDVNDLPVLTEVGLSAAPADAPLEVRLSAFMVTEARGGQGCLREFVEAILRARGEWDAVVSGVASALPR
jgi:3-deoxy-D-manno-octulosonate 8-phosphate phosphatase (KDO 8-P phosphatase)